MCATTKRLKKEGKLQERPILKKLIAIDLRYIPFSLEKATEIRKQMLKNIKSQEQTEGCHTARENVLSRTYVRTGEISGSHGGKYKVELSSGTLHRVVL
jgi:hypothetical protein